MSSNLNRKELVEPPMSFMASLDISSHELAAKVQPPKLVLVVDLDSGQFLAD